jgi:multiple sugar transport system permease protein
MEKREIKAWFFILPGFIGVLLFYIIPFLISLYYTFTKGVTDVQFIWFDNFKDLFGNPTFQRATQNTLKFILIGIPSITLLSLSLSIIMSDKLYSLPRWAMLSPIIIPVASALMGWRSLFDNGGIVNKLIQSFGGNEVDFFGEKHAMGLLIFIFIIKNMGYMLVIFTGAISTLEKEYREAFFLDSNSKLKYSLKIVVPLIAPIIFFVVVFSIINSFQIFREVYGLYGNYPPNTVYLLQHFMNNNFLKLNYQRLSTAAFILVTGISILVSIFLNFQKKFLEE